MRFKFIKNSTKEFVDKRVDSSRWPLLVDLAAASEEDAWHKLQDQLLLNAARRPEYRLVLALFYECTAEVSRSYWHRLDVVSI